MKIHLKDFHILLTFSYIKKFKAYIQNTKHPHVDNILYELFFIMFKTIMKIIKNLHSFLIYIDEYRLIPSQSLYDRDYL